MRTRLLALAAVLTAFVLASPGAPVRAQTSSDVAPALAVGRPAPPFTVTGLDGKPVTLADFHGKTLVVNAWATWCPPCRLETPDLIGAYRKLAGPGVVFLGIDSTEVAPLVKAFVAAKGVAWMQALDTDKSFVRAYGIDGIPTTVVIDKNGIVRAVHEDVVAPAQLAGYVAAANAGENADAASPAQAKIVAALSPDHFTFVPSGTATVKSLLDAVDDAIAKADDTASNDDSPTSYIDPNAVNAAEAALLERAIAQLGQDAQANPVTHAQIARMRGDAARLERRHVAAVAAYDEALALDPNDTNALSGLATSAYEAKDTEKLIAADRKLAALSADDPAPLVDLGVAYTSVHDYTNAAATFAKAVTVAQAAVSRAPAGHKHDLAVRRLAWVHMYFGRSYAKAGEPDLARAQFTLASATALQLPKSDSRYAMYLEQAQEALIALDLSKPSGARTSVSLAPWTGPDLPGSVPSTLKYRLVLAGTAGTNVHLQTAGVPKGWVASFCTDRVCAPFRVGVAIPASGVKVIEFQLVPEGKRVAVKGVRVLASDGTARSWADVPST